MFKNTLVILSLFTVTIANAQITINSSDMPNANDSVLVSIAGGGIGSINPMLSDSNYTWDFSFLIPTLQRYEKFDNPLTFPSPFNFIFNPINCSYGKDNYQLTSLPIPGITLDAAYDFFKESSSQYKQVGAGYTISGIPLPFLYTSSDIIYRFPLDYLNTDSSDYKFGLPIPSLAYYGQTGHRVNQVDGWGTLITPYGTFSTLRIYSTVAAVDTIYIDTIGIGSNIPRPLEYQFKWLATGKKVPVLEIDAVDIAGLMTVTNVQYIDTLQPGVPQVGIVENNFDNTSLSVYPNPSIDYFILEYHLNVSTSITISVKDILGKTVANILNENRNRGTGQINVNAKELGLTPGIYFVNMQTGNSTKIQKIIIIH